MYFWITLIIGEIQGNTVWKFRSMYTAIDETVWYWISVQNKMNVTDGFEHEQVQQIMSQNTVI